MEVQQPVDLERVFKLFCEKAEIKNVEEVLSKSIDVRGPIVTIDVVVRADKICFKILQGLYYGRNDEISKINSVFLSRTDIIELGKFVEHRD